MITIKEIQDTKTNMAIGYLLDYGTHKRSTINIEDSEVKEWIANGGVVEPFETQAEINARLIAEANQAEYDLLDKLDRESIRDIREWIASQPNAPQTLKDREVQAVAARARIIK